MTLPHSSSDIERGLRWALGLRTNVAPVIAMSQRREPILLDGPFGGEQLRVAQLLHKASGADTPMLRVTRSIEFASGATVYVDLAELRQDGISVSLSLLQRLNGTVPIIAARTRAFFDAFHGSTIFPHRITIPPLRQRRDEIAQLLHWSMAEHGFPVRLEAIGIENLIAIRDHPWRRNLAELRDLALRLGAVMYSHNMTQAAQKIGCTRQALSKFFDRFDLDLMQR
jgi:hypothetical protein